LLDTKGVFVKNTSEVQYHGDTKSVNTTLAPHFKVRVTMSPTTVEEREDMSHVPYTSAVDSLVYDMMCRRPDLSQVISMISRYMHDPCRGIGRL